ncbi:hypothetical protein PYW08_009086 [Mythimna loreyi]|uniref:Uncharacterized protein n=1 Tax=Mythimna loreyi TaxID=667449 RepID=A0ACC2Q7N0_9NEOP|nr:hypothetical protein PYW08_009086 [Mythimna loreyi]
MLHRNFNINREAVRVSFNSPRDSGQDKKDEIENDLDPVLQRQLKSRSLDCEQVYRTDLPKPGKYDAVVKPFFPAAFATNLTMNTLEVLEGTLAMRRSANHVTKLNTRLIESIPGGDIAFMNRMMAMGANSNATCRLNHVSACHIAAMHDNEALDLLLRSGADISRSDKHGRTPLHLAAWAGHAKQIALLLNFPETLRKSVLDRVVLSPETLEEVKRLSSPVNKLTNIPCSLNVEATLPDEWSDGMEHNCRNVKETLPLFEQGWTALHSASARAQHHCVQLLLAAGADPNAQDLLCRTPLDVVGYAHYMGYNVDAKNFKETVNLLLKASDKFQRCYNKSNPLDTPLHTAVELECEEIVEKMLLAGASVTAWNSQGLTAMHLCVKKRSKELLQYLANHKCDNDDPYLATVDVKDRTGTTVLCAAVKSEWLQGVCIALGAGASITMKTDGESPIHIAAQLGNTDILQEILTVAKYNSTVDFRNEKGETALFKAIKHNQLEALKLLLQAGASIEVEISDKANVFHIAAKYGNKDVLEHLLEYNSNITAKLINRFDNTGPPLLYAVSNNHFICAELLICKGAQVNAFLQCHNPYGDSLTWTSLLHIAASRNYYDIADLIIKHDYETIHAVNSSGRTPLHEACSHGHREMIALLLRKGADLSAAGKAGISKPISILMNNLSKPTEFMQEIFDSYISSQGLSLQESNCEVVVDYSVLVPDKSNMKQMKVIKALINTGNTYDQDRLLLHPLVQSFLYLKWRSLLPYFYSILVLHVCFVLSLNVYAISVFYYNDINMKNEIPLVLRSDVWIHIIYLTVFLITIQEIIFIKIKTRRYLVCLETWLKFWSIALALVLPRVVSWDTDYSPEWARLIATVALLLTWFEMMFLLSRFPDWGYYVLMFGKVANKVFKILVSFVFLIFGFSVSFMIQFRAEPPFEGPWSAFVTTMVMMTSEFNYIDKLSNGSSVKSSASIIILRLIFVSFLILVAIVLMNLLVGVAVNDVNNLEIIGSIKRLEKQVEFITSLEDIVFNKFIKKIVPNTLYKKWLKNKKWENVIVLRPRGATCSNCNRLPASLREAIFEKAQSQKKQSDEEQGTMLYQMKLDEIYKVIVQKNGGEPPKPESPDNALNKVIESIDKIRSDIEMIKKYIDATKRRSMCSNKSVPLLVVSKSD